jgi:hypothetical protein
MLQVLFGVAVWELDQSAQGFIVAAQVLLMDLLL